MLNSYTAICIPYFIIPYTKKDEDLVACTYFSTLDTFK